MTGRPHSGTYSDGTPRRQYHCNKGGGGCGKVAADMRAVDGELRAFVALRLSAPRHAAAVAAARAQVADRLAAVNAEIADCEAIAEALADRLGRREITLVAFDKANEPLAADLARLRAERDTLCWWGTYRPGAGAGRSHRARPVGRRRTTRTARHAEHRTRTKTPHPGPCAERPPDIRPRPDPHPRPTITLGLSSKLGRVPCPIGLAGRRARRCYPVEQPSSPSEPFRVTGCCVV